MRSRNIKPGFFENESLAKLPTIARLLFAGLWCLADREGRLEDRPERIKAKVLPYDRTDVNRLLDALHGGGFIRRYVVNGAKYISVLKFLKHQNPHRNEKCAGIPPPPTEEVEPCPRQDPEQHKTSPIKTGAAPADSLISDFLIPETRIPQNGIPGPADYRNGQGDGCVCAPEANYDEAFELFISDWPHQVNLSRAKRVWKELFKTADDPAKLEGEIFAGKARYQASDQWDRGVYDGPDKWLQNEKWKDHPAPKKSRDFDWAKLQPGEEG